MEFGDTKRQDGFYRTGKNYFVFCTFTLSGMLCNSTGLDSHSLSVWVAWSFVTLHWLKAEIENIGRTSPRVQPYSNTNFLHTSLLVISLNNVHRTCAKHPMGQLTCLNIIYNLVVRFCHGIHWQVSFSTTPGDCKEWFPSRKLELWSLAKRTLYVSHLFSPFSLASSHFH